MRRIARDLLECRNRTRRRLALRSREAARLLLALALLSFPAAPGPAAEESLDSMKKKSVKLAADVLKVEPLKECEGLCRRILERSPEDRDTLALLSRVCWSLGNHEPDRGTQSEWFTKGMEAAEKIKEVYSETADGYYWYGINYGEWVDRASIFSKIGAKGVIMENMEKVLEYNDKYDGGGAYIVIGRINYVAPGGSYTKAIECFEKAIAINPKRTTAYLYLGELYLHEHLFEKAEKMLNQALSMEAEPRYAIEQRDDRKAAAELLKKLQRKEKSFPEAEEISGH